MIVTDPPPPPLPPLGFKVDGRTVPVVIVPVVAMVVKKLLAFGVLVGRGVLLGVAVLVGVHVLVIVGVAVGQRAA